MFFIVLLVDKNSAFVSLKSLNEPESIPVRENLKGYPVRIGRSNLLVKSIEYRWRIDDEWWRTEPVSRMYFSIILANGIRMVIFKDLIKDVWYQQTIGGSLIK
jgi:hypothetical protein